MSRDDSPLDEPGWEPLALSVEPIEPPAGLKQQLLGRLSGPGRTQPPGFFSVAPGVSGVRSAVARWSPTPLPGIEEKFLAHDDERGVTTRLLRFAPGTRYPNHRHAGTEEIFVLEGSLTINGLLLSAGDYCRSDPGTEEAETFSETGGMAIVISCDRDEIQAAAP